MESSDLLEILETTIAGETQLVIAGMKLAGIFHDQRLFKEKIVRYGGPYLPNATLHRFAKTDLDVGNDSEQPLKKLP